MSAVAAPTRRQVLGFRVGAQQLDRDSGAVADTAVLDLGVQDTGSDGALWALAIRGVPRPPAEDLATADPATRRTAMTEQAERPADFRMLRLSGPAIV